MMQCQTNLADKMIPTLKDTYQKSTLMLAVLHQHNNETKWLPDILILSILPSYFFSLCVFLGLQVPSLRFAALLEQSGLSQWLEVVVAASLGSQGRVLYYSVLLLMENNN